MNYFRDLVTGELMAIPEGVHLNSNRKEEITEEEYRRAQRQRDPDYEEPPS